MARLLQEGLLITQELTISVKLSMTPLYWIYRLMKLEEKDVIWKAARSSGPGGQRVNKKATKVQMWVKVGDLPLTDGEKARIRKKLGNMIDKEDELQVESEEERSQERNKEKALERLNEVITEALEKSPRRIPTKPPRGADEERLRRKHARYQKKKERRENKNPEVEGLKD